MAPYFPGERITARVGSQFGGPHLWQFFARGASSSGGQFSAGQVLTPVASQHVAVGDFDSDGDLDLVLQYRSNEAHFWFNDGTGPFCLNQP